MGASDEVLIRRVAESGDGRAMSELYDRYGGLVHGAGMRYLGDRGLAEDLVQDVFFAVWRSAAGFDPSQSLHVRASEVACLFAGGDRIDHARPAQAADLCRVIGGRAGTDSGTGRVGGRHAMERLTELQTIVIG